MRNGFAVKIGTYSLTLPDGGSRRSASRRWPRSARRARRGCRVILVTSGAIGVGARRLGWKERPRAIPDKQAAAAVGQGLLMREYEQAFLARGVVVGQVLLTAEDTVDRQRYLNSRNTLLKLWEYNAIPIVNENDTVAVDEIRFGDNDTLSAGWWPRWWKRTSWSSCRTWTGCTCGPGVDPHAVAAVRRGRS